MKRALLLLTSAAVVFAGLATPASAAFQNTRIELTTSQGLTGSLLYYPVHSSGAPRYLFGQATVRLECRSNNPPLMSSTYTPSGSTLQTFFVAGTIAPGQGPHHLEATEATGTPGNNKVRKLDVTLTPAPVKTVKKPKKKGSKVKAAAKKKKKKKTVQPPVPAFTAASGTLSFALNSQAGTSPTTSSITICESGPVSISSAGASGF